MMTKEEATAFIKNDLAEMFSEARRDGTWFWCSYQDLWFSPDQLAAEHEKGHFLWGKVNWRLRDPQERVNEAAARAKRAQAEADRVLADVAKARQ